MNNKETEVIFTVCLEKDVKDQADHLWDMLGLDMNTAINIFVRQSIRERGIPFEIRLNSTPTLTIDDFLDHKPETYQETEYWQDDPVGKEEI